MGRAIIIRIDDDRVNAQGVADEIQNTWRQYPVDVIGWPPEQPEIDRLTNTT